MRTQVAQESASRNKVLTNYSAVRPSVHTKLPSPLRSCPNMGSENTPEGPFTVQREIYDPLQDLFIFLLFSV